MPARQSRTRSSSSDATRPPVIARLSLTDLTAGESDDLERASDLEGVEYADVRADHVDLAASRLSAVRFAGLVADEVDLKGARLSEVELDRLNVPSLRAARGQWRDVVVSGRIGAVEAYELDARSVRFTGCKLDYVNLRGAELLDIAFEDCIIDELDLGGASAQRVLLTGTRMSQLDVREARLRDVDLRGATFESVSGLDGLGGATVSTDQLLELAPMMAAVLGLKVDL